MLLGSAQSNISRHGSFSSIPSGGGGDATTAATSTTSSPSSPTAAAGAADAAVAAQLAQLSLSRRVSLTTSVHDARRLSRSASMASSVSDYEIGPVAAAMSRNAMMNARVEAYLVGGNGTGPGSGGGGSETDGTMQEANEEDGELSGMRGDAGNEEDDDNVKLQGKIRWLSKRLTSRLGRRKV